MSPAVTTLLAAPPLPFFPPTIFEMSIPYLPVRFPGIYTAPPVPVNKRRFDPFFVFF